MVRNKRYMDLKELKMVDEYRDKMFSFYATKIFRSETNKEKVRFANELIEESKQYLRPVDNYNIFSGEANYIKPVKATKVIMEVC